MEQKWSPESEAAQPPSDFVRLVRDALVHLYDRTHLLGHPLGQLLADSLPQFGDRAQNLRALLLDAIENLEPSTGDHPSERSGRPYAVLAQRYVGGFAIEAIQDKLHISERQFRREHQKGLQALAATLWARSVKAILPDGLVAESLPAAGLQAELETLRVEFASLSLAKLAESARLPAEALAEKAGVALAINLPGEGASCLCDPTLAKQALLSCLSALFDQQPRYVCLSAAVNQRLPSLMLRITPPLSPDQLADLRHGLATCDTLMSVQGGHMQVLLDEAGSCLGVGLRFRSQHAAHVVVIDDNERMLQLYERYLASGRYRVSSAASAPEAEALLEYTSPDAIVLDVMMREVDGWELLQRLRAQPRLRDVPIVVCSVLNEPKLAFALGAQACLKKPVAADDLLRALSHLLDGSSPAERNPTAL
ncbi:MAG: ATP-binding response regulator [Anaerolineae bacterium]